MEIIKEAQDKQLTITLVGRLDTITSRDLDEEIATCLEGVETLIYDFKELEYVSSAGLRVLLKSQKTMNKQGKMIIKNVAESIMDIFEVTGFSEIFDVQ